nr:early nodulin-20-like [Aegilops tauschii subsp. strangulata]
MAGEEILPQGSITNPNPFPSPPPDASVPRRTNPPPCPHQSHIATSASPRLSLLRPPPARGARPPSAACPRDTRAPSPLLRGRDRRRHALRAGPRLRRLTSRRSPPACAASPRASPSPAPPCLATPVDAAACAFPGLLPRRPELRPSPSNSGGGPVDLEVRAQRTLDLGEG